MRSTRSITILSLLSLIRLSDVLSNGDVLTFPFRYEIHDRNNNNNNNNNANSDGRRLQLSTTTSLPHFDASMSNGALYIDLYVGNPAQKQTLAISVSGDFVAFPCTGCKDCGTKLDEFFRPQDSEGHTKLSCGGCEGPAICQNGECILHETYLDGASKYVAYQAKDIVYVDGQGDNRDPLGTNFGEIYGFPLIFGCLTQMSGYFDTNSADGLLGMSPSKLSFISQIFDAGKVPANIYGLCFNNLDGHVIPKGVSAGAVSLGGIDAGFHHSALVFAKNADPRKLSYRVNLEKIYIRPGGGKSVESKIQYSNYKAVDGDYLYVNTVGRGVYLDTGSPFTYIDRMLEVPFKQAWLAVTKTDYDLTFHANEAEYRVLPTIIFQFTGWDTTIKQDPEPIPGFAGNLDVYNPFSVVVAMPAGAYMLFNETTGFYHPKLYFNSIAGSVLGVNFMTGHHVVFDLQSNRIGFTETDVCIKDPSDPSKPKPSGFYGDLDPFGKLIGDPLDNFVGQQGKEMMTDDGRTDTPLDGSRGSDFDVPTYQAGDKMSSCGTGLYYSACCSATCRSFVAVGYATVVVSFIAVYAAMNVSKSRRARTFERVTPSQPSSFPMQAQPYSSSYSGASRRGGNSFV